MHSQRTYIGAICGHEGSYGIVFPDFPGCVSAGENMQHVLAMGKEALTFHIESMVADGDPIPEPANHTLAEVASENKDPDVDEEWVALAAITVPVPVYPEHIAIAVPTRAGAGRRYPRQRPARIRPSGDRKRVGILP